MQVGPEAAGEFAVGDRVALGTAHAEYTASEAEGVWHVPEGLSDEQACWIFIMGVGELALRRAEEAGALQFGATVGIIGLGMVGLSSLAFCITYVRSRPHPTPACSSRPPPPPSHVLTTL